MLPLHQEILQNILVRYQVFSSVCVIQSCFQQCPVNLPSRGILVGAICSQMLPCQRGLKMKVLGEVILYLFLSWRAMMDVSTGLLKIHRNWDNNSRKNPFLSGGFFYSEVPLVNLNSFLLWQWLITRGLLSWWLPLRPGRKLQVISSKCWYTWNNVNNGSKWSNLI